MTLALFIDSLTGISGYQEAVWLGVTDGATQAGVRIITFAGGALDFSPLNPFEKSRNIAYELFSPTTASGLLLCGGTLGNDCSRETFSAFCSRYSVVPTVSVGPAVPGIPRVLVDNDRGMKEMVNHLIRDHGYTRIGFISGPKGNIDADRRRKMYQEALTENSLIYEEAIVYEGDFNDHSGYEAVLHWISRGGAMPQAIVASNDNMAFGAINALREKGLSVPHQIAVTGFDDVSSAATATPPLSTVSQPIYLQGKKAVELLIQRIKGGTIPEETLEKPNQIYRQSCGCLSATITAFQTEESITLSQFSQ
ncbi:MAG: substrate-binding domain-containing protein, partial [Spirochaetales bacterium]|nr:substrate-binding domain-containing protein [Spirochaetales bacterium]